MYVPCYRLSLTLAVIRGGLALQTGPGPLANYADRPHQTRYVFVYLTKAVLSAGRNETVKQIADSPIKCLKHFFCWKPMHYVNICKGRHFSLLHHFRYQTKHRSRHFNQANHANPFPIYFHFLFPSKSMQIHCTHLILFCFTAVYRYWPTYVEIPIFTV